MTSALSFLSSSTPFLLYMTIFFDVLHLYYLPQYLPVLRALKIQGVEAKLVFYRQSDANLQQVCESVVEQEGLDVFWAASWADALAIYLDKKPDWIVFGNAVDDIEQIHSVSKTVLMQHGIGPKSCYYDVSENLTTVRFIEGAHRLSRLLSLYPEGNFVDTGYAKLDPAISGEDKGLDLASLGLDPNKKTILYAPTFYPSSIELMSKDFAQDFADFNVIVKPHFFSLTKKKYEKQRKLMKHWQKHDNVYLATELDYNLIPFMQTADIMLSDASSAIFEFAALGKPVIWCDFYKLRWSYRGIFSYRFKNRLDSDIEYFNQVALKAKSYSDLTDLVQKAFDAKFEQREKTIEQLAGRIDGHCSTRIVDYLLENSK